MDLLLTSLHPYKHLDVAGVSLTTSVEEGSVLHRDQMIFQRPHRWLMAEL